MLQFPPLNFGAVEANVYRSAIPTELNQSFLLSLQLKTIIYLADTADENMLHFYQRHSIRFIHIDQFIRSSDVPSIGQLTPISDDIVVAALRILINDVNLPVLVACRDGKLLTGVVVGCLRKLQRWSLMSIFEEYRRLAGYSNSGLQQQHEQFIELFDTDLVVVSPDSAPSFLI